jgi:hypothetical protein
MAAKSKIVLSSATWSFVESITSTVTELKPSADFMTLDPTLEISMIGKSLQIL